MFPRSFSLASLAIPLAAAVLLTATPAFAGEHVRSARRSTVPASAAAAPAAPAYASASRAAVVTVSWSMPTPAATQAPQTAVSLRGPDGQTRRYVVEGGALAIQTRQVVVRAGESVTIQVTAR
jgi:hypothetical protein